MHRRKLLHSALSLRKKKMLGPTTKMRRTERNNVGFMDTVMYLLLEGEDSRGRWQDKHSLFFALLNYITESNRNKNFEE